MLESFYNINLNQLLATGLIIWFFSRSIASIIYSSHYELMDKISEIEEKLKNENENEDDYFNY